MMRNLVSEKPGKTYDPNVAFKPRRSTYIHSFDALSYPFLYYDTAPAMVTGHVPNEIIEIGA